MRKVIDYDDVINLTNILNDAINWCVQTRGIHWRDHIYQEVYKDLEIYVKNSANIKSVEDVIDECFEVIEDRQADLDKESMQHASFEDFN